MADDYLRYDIMVQDALRDVMRRSLQLVQKNDGLPGDHHFFISFRTEAPGVSLSDRLKQQHPEEMSIVLQHQFWELDVQKDMFSINLSFNSVQETLIIPYHAVTSFYDPSVQFGLQFDLEDEAEEMMGGSEKTQTQHPKAQNNDDRSAPSNQKPPNQKQKDEAEMPAGEVVNLDAFRKNK